MRAFACLLLASSLVSGFGQFSVTAAEPEPLPNAVLRSQDFWPQARQLTQEQMLLVDRLERAMVTPDPNQVRGLRGQLTLHDAAIERFLKSQYPIPKLLCNLPNVPTTAGGFAPASNLDTPQKTVYCNLYTAAAQLNEFAPLLERRLYMLASVGDVKPLRVVGERPTFVIPGGPTQSPNLNKPATSFYQTAPRLPVTNPPVIGAPMKTAIADYRPPVAPAIAPPPEAMPGLQNLKQLLVQTQSAFPTGITFQAPKSLPVREVNPNGLYSDESQTYAQVLAQPNTGIAHIAIAGANQPAPNVLHNRLETTASDRPRSVSFQAKTQAPEFNPQGLLEINQGQLQVIPAGLNYGFVAPIGDVPLEKLDSRLPAKQVDLPPTVRDFFLTYQPPQQLEAIQVDQRRFLSGKVSEFALPAPLSSQAVVQMGQTYLVRSLQFQLPEVVMSGRPLSGRDRRQLDQLLTLQSRDLLVAVRPVSRRSDGSYVMLWKVLQEFPSPQIQDLDQHVNLSNFGS